MTIRERYRGEREAGYGPEVAQLEQPAIWIQDDVLHGSLQGQGGFLSPHNHTSIVTRVLAVQFGVARFIRLAVTSHCCVAVAELAVLAGTVMVWEEI